ncbi:MAG TPA: hypothetical protein VL053_08505 [Arachidicoccus sp.]|nr:hypothetical protein [Arachidicoccus sp.]
MKKLKLRALELGASEILSREQLKKAIGGDGSDGLHCKNSTCILSIQGSNGSWTTLNGNCMPDTDQMDMGSLILNGGVTYYCETGLGNIPITSNGGVSRCN